MRVEHSWNDSDRGKSKGLGKNLPHCHFATKLKHWPGNDAGRSDGRPANDRRSHDTN